MKETLGRVLARRGVLETLLALAVLALYHEVLFSPVAGWAELLYPLGASWGYRDWRGLGAILTPTYWTAFRYGKGDWVPATFVYFFLERQLAGARPLALNGGALVLLTAAAAMAAAVARRLTGRPLAGLVAGLAFCLHPLFWDSSMTMLTSHLLMGLFCMLAFWAYLKGWLALSCFAYLMAMLSKPPGVVFPALVLAYELLWDTAAAPWRERLRRGSRALLPYLLPAALFFAVFRWVHPGLQGVTSGGFTPDWTVKDPLLRLEAVSRGLLGWHSGPDAFKVCLALLACAAVSGRLLFFLAWSLITLSPYLNLIPLEGLARTMSFKDFQPRYALLACAAFGWTAAAGLMRALESGPWRRRAAQVLLLLLGLAAAVAVRRPVHTALPEAPLTRLLSLPFVRAADPAAYEALLAEASQRYGAPTAAAFAEISGSGLLYDDPDMAGLVRHIVYDLDFHPIFDSELPPAFLERIRSATALHRDWTRALEPIGQEKPDQALPLLEQVLRRDPNHAQAALAASGILWRKGRKEMAGHLYVLARAETGLGHAALMRIACSHMRPVCARLSLEKPGYEAAMRETSGADLDGPGPALTALVPADGDLVFSYARAMDANGHFAEAERACSAALQLLDRKPPAAVHREQRAEILLLRADLRRRCQDPEGALLDLEHCRRLVSPESGLYARWKTLTGKTRLPGP